MKTSGHYLFHEEQSFRNSKVTILVLLVILGTIIVQGYGLYQQLYLHKPWGDQPMPDNALILSSVGVIIIVLFIALLLMKMTLITEVRYDGLYYRFPILINKEKVIRKEDIAHYEVGKYHPLLEYGGWGIRYRLGKGKAFNIKGNQGAKFFLKNGKKFLFGTQQPVEFKKALDKMMNPSNL